MTFSAARAAPRPVTPVGILAEQLGRICARAEELDLGEDLIGEIRRAHDLAVGLDPYIDGCTTPESAALAALAARTHAADWDHRVGVVHLEQEMLSGHVEGQMLKMLIRWGRARRVLEIGTFTGYSALAMAEALPADGELVACELDPGVAAFAQESFAASPDGNKITLKVGPALDSLAELATDGRTFDLVFIDADKGGYLDYLRTLLSTNLLAANALICVDNTLMQGQPYLPGTPTGNGAAIAAFNRAVAADERVEQVVLPLRDGLTLIRRVGDA